MSARSVLECGSALPLLEIQATKAVEHYRTPNASAQTLLYLFFAGLAFMYVRGSHLYKFRFAL